MKSKTTVTSRQILVPFVWLTMLCVGMLLIRIWVTKWIGYWYLAWNLFLAWIPLLLAIGLNSIPIARGQWSRLKLSKVVSLSMLWLLFLPNSFYIITDFIHLLDTQDMNIYFDIVMLGMYTLTGYGLGYISVYLVQRQLGQVVRSKYVHGFVLGAMLLSGFAIYLGRYLRWNSWDIIVNPLGLFYDIGIRLIQPFEHGLTYGITILFFLFIAINYYVLAWLVTWLKKTKIS